MKPCINLTCLIFASAVVFFSCSETRLSDSVSRSVQTGNEVSGVYLKKGNLVSFNDFKDIPPKEFLPWTVQERISGFIHSQGLLYMVLNSHGFLVADISDREFSIRRIKNRELFSGRSAGDPFSAEGKIFCHLVWNTTFNTPKPEGRPVALASYEPGTSVIVPFYLPFQERNPEWEAVELFYAII